MTQNKNAGANTWRDKTEAFADVLFLYAGCDVIVYISSDKRNNISGKLIGTANYGALVSYGNTLGSSFQFPCITPLLRRTNTLTGKEFIRLYDIGAPDKTDCQGHVKIDEVEFRLKENSWTPLQFKYLLSLGVDLFGLIDAGYAKEHWFD